MKPTRRGKLTINSNTTRRLLIIMLLLVGGLVHAEGGCPPGQIPHSGTDLSSCGPIPPGYYNNQTPAQPPPPQWASQWGAIATYEPNGSLGTTTNMPSQRQAEQTALMDCQSMHGSICKIQLSYHNQCAAMIVSDKGFNTGSAATADQAIQRGMKICKDSGDPNCHVYYSACSLPQRIQ